MTKTEVNELLDFLARIIENSKMTPKDAAEVIRAAKSE